MSEPERSEPALARWPVFLAGAGLGLLAAYVLDPQSGPRRRAGLVSRTHLITRKIWRTLDRNWPVLTARLRAFSGQSRNLDPILPERVVVDDATLVQRVRDEFGYAVRFGQAIRVDATEGVVTLSGPVLTENLGKLLTCVRAVPGVRSVIDELDRHERDFHVSH